MNNLNITSPVLEKIQRANRDFLLFDGCERMLVGLSGGADSTCLLLAMCRMGEIYGFKVSALHVNHMIRHGEADRDEQFARLLCERMNVEFFCERIDVPQISKQTGESIELCARNCRYRAFEKVCAENKITHVATAHNACDNAETTLFNLARGTGMKGLCGIPAKRILCKNVIVVRPLIYVQRTQIEEYLSDLSQDFVVDSTNGDTDYTRNYIRKEILPRMKNVNSEVVENISRATWLCRKDEEFLSFTARENVTDDIQKLAKLHESILSRIVIMLFSKFSDETLTQFHVKQICDKIYSYDGSVVKISVVGGMSCVLCRGKVYFEKDLRQKKEKSEGFCKELCEGENFFGTSFALYVGNATKTHFPETISDGENIYKKYTTDYLYFDTIPNSLFARSRRDKDTISSGGMNKSVKRIMNSQNVPRDERFLLPFVCDDGKILCIPSVAVCDECKKMNDNGRECVAVVLYKKDFRS